MPYYKITIVRKDGRVARGIKEDFISDIDRYASKAYKVAKEVLKNEIKSFEVVMVTSHCKEVKEYIERKQRLSRYAAEQARNSVGENYCKVDLTRHANGKFFMDDTEAIIKLLPNLDTYGYPFATILHKNIPMRFAKSEILINGYGTGKYFWQLVD